MPQNIMQQVIFGNRVLDYITFFSFLIIGILIVYIFNIIILRRIKKWGKVTIETIEKTVLPLLYFGVFYLAVGTLKLNPAINNAINVLGIVLLTIFSIRFLVSIANYSIEFYFIKREKDPAKRQSLKGILAIVKVIIWGLAIVFLLDNLGFKISAVIAGLGIGGVAVALAAQAILGDLFSYFAIFFDRPFEVGDFIIIGDYLGSVEHIGIKTTRIRSLGGEQLIFSNTDLTNSRVRNYKRMQKRRVVFKLGVTYQTGLDKLKEIPKVIENVIKNIKDTGFDRAHFFQYGDFSLVFEVVYYIMGSDYNKYMDIQQEINFAIKEEFEKRGIEFAYPTQTLFLEKTAT